MESLAADAKEGAAANAEERRDRRRRGEARPPTPTRGAAADAEHPDNNQVYTVFGNNLEFHQRIKKKGVTGGWGLICIGKDGIEEAFEICKMTIDLIAEHPQEEGIKIIHPGEGGEDVYKSLMGIDLLVRGGDRGGMG